MGDDTHFIINTDVKFAPLQLVDIKALADACPHDWYNQTLCRVNDCVIRFGVLKGEFHWHSHGNEDEYFQVLEGRLLIDLDGRTIELGPGQGTVIARGIEHRPRAPERTVVLMIAGVTITPTGDP